MYGYGERHETEAEKNRRIRKQIAEARMLAEKPIHPPTGPIWNDLRTKHSGIPEVDLIFLLALIIDFWWKGTRGEPELECSEHEDRTISNETTYVRIGRKHHPTSYRGDKPGQYNSLLVRGQYYCVTHKDCGWRNGTLYQGVDCWLAVGICPAAKPLDCHFDQDMRQSDGYRQVLFLPYPDEEPPLVRSPEDIGGDEVFNNCRNWTEQQNREYRVRAHIWRRKCQRDRALLLLGEAWRLQYLLFIWCGIRITEGQWQTVMATIIDADPDKWDRALQESDLDGSFALPEGGEKTVSRLQSLVLLQLAHQRHLGISARLTDPLNWNSKQFQDALHFFRFLPGLRHTLTTLTSRSQAPRNFSDSDDFVDDFS
jgi:hypothetical protein